jgi:hypothetical protein
MKCTAARIMAQLGQPPPNLKKRVGRIVFFLKDKIERTLNVGFWSGRIR